MNIIHNRTLYPTTFLLVVCLSMMAFSQSWAAKAVNQFNSQENLNRAKLEVEKRSYAAAVKTLSDILKSNPDLAEAYYLRAKSLDMMGQPMRALKDIGRYIELKPHDSKGYILKGDVNNFNMDHREAIDSYSHALRVDPGSVNALVGRGLAYAALEKYDLAIKDYEEAIKGNRLNLEALTNLGMALALSGKTEEAVQRLTEALALERDLEWRARLNRLIDEISQSLARPSTTKPARSPFRQAPSRLLEKPW